MAREQFGRPDLGSRRIPLSLAAAHLGCSPRTLRRRAEHGELEIIRDDGRCYLTETEYRAYRLRAEERVGVPADIGRME